MGYYHRLEDELRNFPGCSWLAAKSRTLEIPKDLIAPGLAREDYDRLSVAYGLSFLDVGKIVKSVPLPIVPVPEERSWQYSDRFISKDFV
jgi:hypothetical protein